MAFERFAKASSLNTGRVTGSTTICFELKVKVLITIISIRTTRSPRIDPNNFFIALRFVNSR
jgi:hypothetical protein